MAPIKRQRLRKPVKRWDPVAFREAMADGKVHVSLALVVLEGGSHFEVVESADVLVSVELQPSGVRCTARLGGMGIHAVPPVGAEVVVLVPDGEIEAGPVIVARSGEAPDGLDATTLVIVAPAGGRVLVHDGSAGEAVELATKADVQALRDTVDANKTLFDAHVHSGGTLTGALTGTTATPMLSPAQPAGTDVLRAK